jgi:hypothetical protein
MKKVLASTYISNPLEALKKVKYNLEQVLTDENISKELDWDIEEVRSIITSGIRKRLTVSNISNPLEALKKVKYNLENILTDENIAKELNWYIEEVKGIVDVSIKKELAYKNITDPLEALRIFKHNLEDVLTDENIAKELGWDIEEVKEIVTIGMKKALVIRNISDPLKNLKKVKYNLLYTLTDENIAKALNISTQDAKDRISLKTRTYFAINNLNDPLKSLINYYKNKGL